MGIPLKATMPTGKSTYMDCRICVAVSVHTDSNVQNILNKMFYNPHSQDF